MTLPDLPPSFAWTQTPLGLVLKCHPLETIAPHLFTTRDVPISSADEWKAVAELIGATDAVTLNQVHGREVVTIRNGATVPDDDAESVGTGLHARREADALVSDDPRLAIAVRAADCVPLLLADRKTGAVAAVHAGWRGTAAGVAVAAVEALSRDFGVQPQNLVAAIGPSIGACCYEVGSELVDAFAAAGHARHLIDRWFAIRGQGAGIRGKAGGTLVLDVPGANRDQLVLAGVPEDQIFLSGLCTAMHLDVLTSYRAEKAEAGRIAGVIRSR
jgi:YfiH family protein